MKRPVAWVIGVLGTCSVAAAMLACSDDDNSGSSPNDSGPDVTTMVPNGPMPEASGAVDAGAEAAAAETGAEAAASADASASDGSNASDAADAMACTVVDASLDEASVRAGLTLAMQYKCSNCHGSGLVGNMMSIVDAGQVYPPNLTPDPMTGLGCWTEAQIERAILDGVDNEDQTLCVMPHFRGKFLEAGVDPDGAAAEITQFLLSAPPVSHNVPDTVCPTASDAGTD